LDKLILSCISHLEQMRNFIANSIIFVNNSFNSRKELIKVLRKRYYEITENNLKIFGVSTKYLKDFVTSERDQLRKITRMPSSEYRMWEENEVREEKP
jgi:hypothetical protein